jgi:hypothetical protein
LAANVSNPPSISRDVKDLDAPQSLMWWFSQMGDRMEEFEFKYKDHENEPMNYFKKDPYAN